MRLGGFLGGISLAVGWLVVMVGLGRGGAVDRKIWWELGLFEVGSVGIQSRDFVDGGSRLELELVPRRLRSYVSLIFDNQGCC